MAYLQQASLALSLLAAAAMTTPALAHNHLADAELNAAEAVQSATPADAEVVDGAAIPAVSTAEATDEGMAEAAVDASLLALPPAESPENGAAAFDTAGIESVLLGATVEAAPEVTETVDLAQSTRAAYEITPAYLGVGGNIGIGERNQSALSSFGFNIISKISLGPRFSVRAGATATNDRWGFTIPITYNFNTISYGGFRAQPYVGAGVEIPTSGDVGLLVNAGADVPISRDFTLNGAANFRLTSGFALGISLGVGYNFPFIFE